MKLSYFFKTLEMTILTKIISNPGGLSGKLFYFYRVEMNCEIIAVSVWGLVRNLCMVKCDMEKNMFIISFLSFKIRKKNTGDFLKLLRAYCDLFI